MSQRLLEKVEPLSTSSLDKIDSLPYPEAAINKLRQTEQIAYSYERRNRPWFEGQLAALKALSISKASRPAQDDSDWPIHMDIPGHGRISLPIDGPALDADPHSALRQIVYSIETITGLRPQRETANRMEEIQGLETQLTEAQETHSLLQEKYNQLIVDHEEIASASRRNAPQSDDSASEDASTPQLDEPRLDDTPLQSATAGEPSVTDLTDSLIASRNSIQAARIELHEQSLQVTKMSATIGYSERYLRQLESDNRVNTSPIRAAFYLDSYLDTPENLTFLAEMGYEAKFS